MFDRWGIKFKDPKILANVCTHPSVQRSDFEVYEFLGDKILGFVVAVELLRGGNLNSEGALSQAHSTWVNKHTLAKLGGRIGIETCIKHKGNFKIETLLADGFEAFVGGLYLDQGLDVVVDFWRNVIVGVEPVGVSGKTRLQEWAHGRKEVPQYTVVRVGGSAHQPVFEARVTVGDLMAVGRGISKKDAENTAVRGFIEQHLI